jgi:hypothetical protein
MVFPGHAPAINSPVPDEHSHGWQMVFVALVQLTMISPYAQGVQLEQRVSCSCVPGPISYLPTGQVECEVQVRGDALLRKYFDLHLQLDTLVYEPASDSIASWGEPGHPLQWVHLLRLLPS